MGSSAAGISTSIRAVSTEPPEYSLLKGEIGGPFPHTGLRSGESRTDLGLNDFLDGSAFAIANLHRGEFNP